MKGFTKEVKIALVAIVGVIILFFGMNFLKGLNVFSSTDDYYIEFKDISGLSTSSPIYADGFKVLKITELDNDVEWSVIYSCDENLQNQKEIFRFVGGSVDCMDGYLYVISTDYDKFFYQCDTGTIYLANTCFTGEGTYISDIYGLDESSDKLYIDGHDYTGMKPGDIITSDQSEQTVTGWTEFRDTYFTKLEDADQSVVKTFDWVKWPEE